MTDDLRDLLARAGRDEASAARGEDFHGAFGDVVRGRVKWRRAVRAAGVGSVAAVSVGAIAFGAVRLPGMTDAGPLGAADCPPGTVASPASAGAGAPASEPGVEPSAHAIDVTSERDRETWLLYDDVAQEVVLEVAAVREGAEAVVEVTEAGGEPYRVEPNEAGNFVFEAPSGGWVTFAPGLTPALDWSLAAPVAVMFDGSTYTVSSASGASVELFVEDGELNMREPGGSSAVRAQDGVYAIELPDGVVVNADIDPDSGELAVWAASDGGAPAEPIGAGAEPGFVCVTPEPSPTPSTPVDACVDGWWGIDAEVLRPDISFAPIDMADPWSQESSTPGVAIQPVLLGLRTITMVLDSSTGEPLAMLERPTQESVLHARISDDEALTVGMDDEGHFTFELDDGRWMTVPAQNDLLTGEDVTALSANPPDAISPSQAPDGGETWDEAAAELAEDFDLEWPESPWVCGAAGRGNDVTDGSTTSPSPAPSPGVSADPAAASSPYQCGFRFDADQQEHSDWAVTRVEWLEPEEAVRQLTDLYGDPSAVYEGSIGDGVLRIEVDGSLIAGEAAGELGSFDPGREGSQLQSGGEAFESTSIAVVQVVEGEVVGRTPDSSRGDEGWLVDRATGGSAAFGLLLDMDALTACEGADVAGADLYAVAAAATVDADGTQEGPLYSWQKVEAP